MSGYTKGPWRSVIDDTGGQWSGWPLCVCPVGDDDRTVVRTGGMWPYEWDAHTSQAEAVANARLIAAAPDLLEAALAYAAWMERENNGRPDYGQLTRDTHPDGHEIWRKWYDETLDMCQQAQDLNRAAIARSTGETK